MSNEKAMRESDIPPWLLYCYLAGSPYRIPLVPVAR